MAGGTATGSGPRTGTSTRRRRGRGRAGRGGTGPPAADRREGEPGAAPGSGPPRAARPWRRPPPPENRIYFADYRDVDGLKWPFRLRRAIGPDTVEETTFDRFRINTKIDPKKFEVPK